MKASKIASIIENEAPVNLAEKWDNVGFQLGSKRKDVKKVLTSLDITKETVKEAIDKDVDMICSHHPFFFKKLGFIDTDTAKGKMIKDLIENDITVYSAHTNLDKAENGLSTYLLEKLGVKGSKALAPDNVNQNFYKLIIYTPVEDTQVIMDALFKAGAGTIGSFYDKNSYRSEGTSTFLPKEGSKPHLGEVGEFTEANESKIETIIDSKLINRALSLISQVHPYEEFAYDLFPIDIKGNEGKEGLGRIGSLDQAVNTADFIKTLRKVLKTDNLREAGPRPEKIKTIAICTGSGAEFIRLAKNKKADVYITGDLKYHDGQLADELGIWTIDGGHFGTEKEASLILKSILDKELNNKDVEVIVSESSSDFIKNLVD